MVVAQSDLGRVVPWKGREGFFFSSGHPTAAVEVAPWLPLWPGWFSPWFPFLRGFPFHKIMESSRLEKNFRISKSIHPFLLPLHVLIFIRGFLHGFLSVSRGAFLFLFHPVLVTWKHTKDRLLQNTSTRVSLLGPASWWRAAALAAFGGVFFLLSSSSFSTQG